MNVLEAEQLRMTENVLGVEQLRMTENVLMAEQLRMTLNERKYDHDKEGRTEPDTGLGQNVSEE